MEKEKVHFKSCFFLYNNSHILRCCDLFAPPPLPPPPPSAGREREGVERGIGGVSDGTGGREREERVTTVTCGPGKNAPAMVTAFLHFPSSHH